MTFKRAIAAGALIAAAAAASAELRKPARYVEVGVESAAGASNSYFSAKEFMVKDLVIDLGKVASEMGSGGWKAEFFDREKVFLNVNAGEKFRLGLFAGVDAGGYLNIGSELFDFLGSGYRVGESKSVELNGYVDVFADAGVSIRTKIRDFGVTITPAYYVPLIYMPSTTATANFTSDASGRMVGSAEADLRMYSAVDMSRWLGKDGSKDDPEVTEQVQEALKNGGFDLSLAVEHPIFGQWLEVGGFARIPILAGKLNYEARRTVRANISTDGLLKVLDDQSPEKEFDTGSWEFSEGGHKVWRPFRIGAEAAFRPFGRWFTLRPMAALVVRDLYTSGSRVFYPEYSLDATASLFDVLSLTLGTAYLNRAFVHSAVLAINARIIEIDAGIGVRSPSFTKSFMGSGLSASLAVKMGF